MLHLKPDGGWFGDPIPFYWDGVWHLFYLRDQQHHALPGGRHVWGHFVSRDLVAWDELPLAIPLGEIGAPDSASCGTGSVIERAGVFHLFYLGRYIASNGDRRETICQATSRDLVAWEKDPANPISRPDPARYGLTDWRDPFPFWNDEAREYWMLVTATLRDAPASRHGCLALLTSPDLAAWSLREPFWSPHLAFDHECPDLFRWGDWWYLIYSTVGEPNSSGTLCRRARSLAGPWEALPVEALEGPRFYAGKTAFDGERRMLFGWVPTREGDADAGRVQWGGHGAVREVVQGRDGALWVRCPPEILALGSRLAAPLTPRLGSWEVGDSAAVSAVEGLAYATVDGLPESFTARVRFRPTSGAPRFGLFLRADPRLESGYVLSVDPRRARITLAPIGLRRLAADDGLSRPLPGAEGREVEVVVVAEGSIVEAYVDGRVAVTGRFYDRRGGALGLYVEDGGGAFSGLEIRALGEG